MGRAAEERSFWDHLEELRRKIIPVLIFVGAAFLFSYFFFSRAVVDLLVRASPYPLYYLSVFEPFLTRLRVSAAVSLVAAVPLLMVQAARFVLPGLYRAERVLFASLASILAALVAAVGFALFRFSPLLLSYFLNSFASPGVSRHLSVATVVSFYIMLLVGDALIVLIPVAVFLLLKTGLITSQGVRASRKVVIPLFMLVAAIITPPDPFTMIAVALPLWLVYEATLVAMRAADRVSSRVREREIR
jgi:sec-independent protein translocase protein TatC